MSVAMGAVVSHVTAGPFASSFQFDQPDGTRIELWGEGNEFYSHFQTPDGYTVIFVPTTKTYEYARLSANGGQLLPTGIRVGKGDPNKVGLKRHLHVRPEFVRQQARKRLEEWDKVMQVSTRWQELKATRRKSENVERLSAAGVTSTSTGTKVGLCLLIDFEDEPWTIPKEEISDFCNADFYEGYGNNGSVKSYFYDNSGGLLIYSNLVVGYIRIPNSLHPRSYYDDTSQSCFRQGNLLIRDAISVMRGWPNYTSEILPQFQALTTDSSNNVVALNVFFAGDNSGAWAYGLWPSSGGLTNVGAQELSPGGKKVWRYQMTEISSTLEIGLFCHENGHLLFGYPDVYDYDFDSSGGAGVFCLMNNGWRGGNPTQISAYLKYVAGWGTVTELTSTSSMTATLTASAGLNFNHFYRYAKPESSTEYFLFENRQAVGRDANMPSSGIAVWHVDELGDHNNQSLRTNAVHANFELTLVQADNAWDLQWNRNEGDENDLFSMNNSAAEYANQLSDYSRPNARWWDGSLSGLNVSSFSQPADVMTFVVQPALRLSSKPDTTLNDRVLVTLLGTPGAIYEVGFSQNLRTWSNIATLTNVTGQVTFTRNKDSDPGGGFFRARLRP